MQRCILDIAVKLGIVEKSGAWLSYGNGKMHCQGREKAIAFLKENEDIKNELSDHVKQGSV